MQMMPIPTRLIILAFLILTTATNVCKCSCVDSQNPMTNTIYQSSTYCSSNGSWILNSNDTIQLPNSFQLEIHAGIFFQIQGNLSGIDANILVEGQLIIFGSILEINSIIFSVAVDTSASLSCGFLQTTGCLTATNLVLRIPNTYQPNGSEKISVMAMSSICSTNSSPSPTPIIFNPQFTIEQEDKRANCDSATGTILQNSSTISISMDQQKCDTIVSPSSDDSDSHTAIVLGILFSLLGLILAISLAALLYKRRMLKIIANYDILDEAFQSSHAGQTLNYTFIAKLPTRKVIVSADSLGEPNWEIVNSDKREVVFQNVAAYRDSLYPLVVKSTPTQSPTNKPGDEKNNNNNELGKHGKHEKEHEEKTVVAISKIASPTQQHEDRLGDPVADTFSIRLFNNLYLFCIADGCGWGRPAVRASSVASKAFIDFLTRFRTEFKSINRIGQLVLKSLEVAHSEIVDDSTVDVPGRTTLLGGVVMRIPNSNQWDFVFVSLGDCKVFLYQKTKGKVIDLTEHLTLVRTSGADSGGFVGADFSNYESTAKQKPDLRNLYVGHCTCETDDMLILLSDGIHDNILPVHCGLSPRDVDSSLVVDDWDRLENGLEIASNWRTRKIQKIIEETPTATPKTISSALLEIAMTNSEPARNWMETPTHSGRLPKGVPGKLDHASVVCIQLQLPLVVK